MLELAHDEIPLFLHGLLSAMVLNRAHDTARDLSEEQWREQRRLFIGTAFDDIVMRFAEPLRSRLQADRETFVARLE